MTIRDEPWKHRHPAWEPIDHSSVVSASIGTARLLVTGGWLYKVTEWDHGHFGIAICFVPNTADAASTAMPGAASNG
jgi:hypothetical protein